MICRYYKSYSLLEQFYLECTELLFLLVYQIQKLMVIYSK